MPGTFLPPLVINRQTVEWHSSPFICSGVEAWEAGDYGRLSQPWSDDAAASIIAYNDEEDLACTLRIAFFSAIRRWRLVREASAGKGYADLVLVPLASSGAIPGVVVELKWGVTPGEVVTQIRGRGYTNLFRGTSAERNVVLCGISYDPKTKTHFCVIER